MAPFAAEDIFIWWSRIAGLDAADLISELGRLLDRVESLRESNEIFIKAEVVKRGAAQHLLTIAGTTGICASSNDAAERRGKSLTMLLRLLAHNEEACEMVGGHESFGTLLKLVLKDLDSCLRCPGRMNFEGLTAMQSALSCMNLVLAVSAVARGKACEAKSLGVDLARLALGKGPHFTPGFLKEMAVEALSHLTTPDCDEAQKISLPRNDECCVCLEYLESGSCVWKCHVCCQGLHASCAQEWLSKRKRCPYCRAWRPPDQEIKDLLRADDFFEALDCETVSCDVPKQFRIALLIAHLSCLTQTFTAIEILRDRGFFSQLLAATDAAVHQQEWPAGSNAFPLAWKMAITIEQLARNGFAQDLVSTNQPLVVFLCKSENESHQAWCIRALRACICHTDSSTKERVDELLVAEAGDDFDAECFISETQT